MTGRAVDPQALDVVSAAFGRVLRVCGVAASPAEVIEVRRVLAVLGARDLGVLRAGLKAVTVKYDHETDAFTRAFDRFFGLLPAADEDGAAARLGHRDPGAEGLPTNLELAQDDDPLGRYADYNPRAAEVGDLVDAPEEDKGFNPHRDDDDLSMAGSDSDLSVSSDTDRGRRGVSYTVDLERAGSAVAKELSTGMSAPVAGAVDWDDPAAILAMLADYDPYAVYVDGVDELTSMQLSRLVEAITEFVAALAERTADRARPPVDGQASTTDPADVQLACHELLRHMRGAPHRVPREHSRGPLDVRHTVRRSMRTDGVPFHLVTRRAVPDRVRLLVVADVSLSVRSITAFALRLAQNLHRMAFRCRVLAYVDTPVDVTETLLRTSGDQALGAVLADPRLDLDATSDYGRVLTALTAELAGLVDRRTAVLFVGDGRCNGLPSGVEELRTLRRRAHRVGWITPEPRRYWTQASCAMPDYADIVDGVVVARDADELVARAAELGHALS